MQNNLGIYHCPACGYTLEVVELGKKKTTCTGVSYALTCSIADAQVVCCGKPMKLLEPNTAEASTEKHLPVVSFAGGGNLKVAVGSVAHPMTAEHFIQWITIIYGNHSQRFTLKPDQAPEAVFQVGEAAAVDVYAYCNLHGLWKTSATK